MNNKKRFFLLLSLSLTALTACSTSTLKITVQADDTVNHSLPVLIRIYTLKNTQKFNEATFRELWHNDKSILGNSLVSQQSFSIAPGATHIITLFKKSNTRFIGVVGLFCHPYNRHWRAITPMPFFFGPHITISGNTVLFT